MSRKGHPPLLEESTCDIGPSDLCGSLRDAYCKADGIGITDGIFSRRRAEVGVWVDKVVFAKGRGAEKLWALLNPLAKGVVVFNERLRSIGAMNHISGNVAAKDVVVMVKRKTVRVCDLVLSIL